MVPLFPVHVELIPELAAASAKNVSLGGPLRNDVHVILEPFLLNFLQARADLATRQGPWVKCIFRRTFECRAGFFAALD